jgi:hypothetical protein
MEPGVEDRSPQKTALEQASQDDKRQVSVLERVISEVQSDDPWHVRLRVSLIWAAGIALTAALVATLIWGVRALFAHELFTFGDLSNHLFWASALLMIGGMFAPSASELERARDPKKRQDRSPRSMDDRRTQRLERRLRRVYDPWRWRVWGGAALSFALTVLVGLLGRGPS